jgi:hypothetical protein
MVEVSLRPVKFIWIQARGPSEVRLPALMTTYISNKGSLMALRAQVVRIHNEESKSPKIETADETKLWKIKPMYTLHKLGAYLV